MTERQANILWPDAPRELQALLRPSTAYAHPGDVLRDPDLTIYEKRAILSSWASDACAVESAPGLRLAPGAPQPVSFDDIIDALRSLDGDDPPPRPAGGKKRHPPWRSDREEGGGSHFL